MKKHLILIPTDSVDELLQLYENLSDLTSAYRKSKSIAAGRRLRKVLSEIQKKAKASRAEIIVRRKLKAAAHVASAAVSTEAIAQDPHQTKLAL